MHTAANRNIFLDTTPTTAVLTHTHKHTHGTPASLVVSTSAMPGREELFRQIYLSLDKLNATHTTCQAARFYVFYSFASRVVGLQCDDALKVLRSVGQSTPNKRRVAPLPNSCPLPRPPKRENLPTNPGLPNKLLLFKLPFSRTLLNINTKYTFTQTQLCVSNTNTAMQHTSTHPLL